MMHAGTAAENRKGAGKIILGLALFLAVFTAGLGGFSSRANACMCNCYRAVGFEATCAARVASCTAGIPPLPTAIPSDPFTIILTAANYAASTQPGLFGRVLCLANAGWRCGIQDGNPPGSGGCVCSLYGQLVVRAIVRWQADLTRQHIIREFNFQKDWFVNDFFNNYIYRALLAMTNQLTVVGMHQVMTVGAMIDAKHQLETQRLFQQLEAKAHKDYHPSAGMCTFGTAARGLAAAERRAQANTLTLARRLQDRQMGNENSASSESMALDRAGRLLQFKQRYCDINDNNAGLFSICMTGANGPTAATINRDVDYTRTLSLARTLDVDFTDAALSGDEQDIIAMSSYLYANTLPARITSSVIMTKANQDDYLDWRSVAAKRNVAENSFSAIVGMKSRGKEDFTSNTQYVHAILTQLGVTPAEAAALIGNQPSYYALMEVLTQRIYQSPEFYTNLYDKPANVDRKDVAMQAIGLMLDRDAYRSELRYESMLSILLETKIMEYQEGVQNRLNAMGEKGRSN